MAVNTRKGSGNVTENTADNAVVNVVKSIEFDDDTLRSINSFDDAMRLMASEMGGQLVSADELLGDGFATLNDEEKDRLVGRRMIFLDWKFSIGDFGPFVVARVVADDGGKYRLIDGSTGIFQQLNNLTATKGLQNGLGVKHGLRKSEYRICANGKCNEIWKRGADECEECGHNQSAPAATYYIDESA